MRESANKHTGVRMWMIELFTLLVINYTFIWEGLSLGLDAHDRVKGGDSFKILVLEASATFNSLQVISVDRMMAQDFVTST